ncbi:MAG: mevalonate kinase [Thermoproteota archaeon]|nr:mevalonate kinase [Thermoproteota archaeon]
MIRNLSRASAPAKVMMFGEHFVVYGSPAILGSIDRRVRISARLIQVPQIIIHSDAGISASFAASKLNAAGSSLSEAQKTLYPLYLAAYEVINNHSDRTGTNWGVKLNICSDIPLGIGLGSSAASCVATVGAVGSLFLKPDRKWIFARAHRAEKLIHKSSSGGDCYVSTFGGLIYYIRNGKKRKIRTKRDICLIVVNTGIKHSTKELVSFVETFRNQNKSLFNDLADTATCICDQAVSALAEDNLVKLGILMNKNHGLLAALGVSNAEIENIVRFCLDSGAYGAKLTGAGGGGSVIALVPDEYKTEFVSKMRKKNPYQCLPVQVRSNGLLRY